jgi:hypothetical protein
MDHYELSMLDDVSDSAFQAADQALRLSGMACSPKWLVVAAHSAAQAAMTCYLNQGNGVASWRKNDAAAWLKAHVEQRAEPEKFKGYPEVRLNYFMELYADVKATAKAKREDSITASLTKDVGHWTNELNQLRNSFIHFQTNHHLVFKQHVVSVAQAASAIVRALSESPSFPWWWSDEAERSRTSLKRHLNALDNTLATLTAPEAG